mmetsp:Transcript_42520/g.83104  ORF Transcript_42520/g.83104 Transcript_42520/m.83104 type:complete len:132 (-) Transcript_42520:36-431(-)
MGNTVDCCSGAGKFEKETKTIQEQEARQAMRETQEEDDLPAELGGKMSAKDDFTNPFATSHSKMGTPGRSKRPPEIDSSPPEKAKWRSPRQDLNEWTPNRVSVQQAKEAQLVTRNKSTWDSPGSESSVAHC